MSKRSTIIISGLATIILFTVGGFSLIIYEMFFRSYYVNVPLAEKLLIDTKWMEIRPPKPLKVEKENQLISIEVAPPVKAFGVNGISLPNGKRVNLEIKLIDSSGKEYVLTYRESMSSSSLFSDETETASYGIKNEPSKDVEIESVLIRSDIPIPAKRILWSGFDWKDVK